MEKLKKIRKYSTSVLNQSKPREDTSGIKIVPEVVERLRNFGRYSRRILNRLKYREDPADFNFITDFKEEKCSVVWNIDNIHRCTLKCGEFLESPEFSTKFGYEVKWTLRLYPKGRKTVRSSREGVLGDCNRAVGLFIHKVSDYPVTSSLKCRFSCKREFLNSSPTKDCSCFFHQNAITDIEIDSRNSSEYGTNNLFCIESLKSPQKLQVKCTVVVTDVYNNNEGTPADYLLGVSKSCSLKGDLKELYINGKFSDITLQAKDFKFPVHKAILASRSDVFDAMFQHNLKKTQTNVVQLHDIKPAVLNNMLQYIYTGSVDYFNIEIAMSLYPVADRFMLHELKEWCVDMMLENLRLENVCKMAVLADLHPDPKLEEATLNMFRIHANKIFKKKEWKDLVQDSDRHFLVSNILQAISTDLTTNFS